MGEPRFSWHLLPDVFEFWEELTLIVEAFLKELLNTVNISVKIPVKNTEMHKTKNQSNKIYCNDKILLCTFLLLILFAS